MSEGTTPVPAAARWAREAAAELLEEIQRESRREAAEIVRARLTGALVEELERLVAGAGRGAAAAPAASAPVSAPARRDSRSGRPVSAPARGNSAPGRPVSVTTPPVAGWYVYGLTWEDAARSLRVIEGIDGAPLEVVATGSLAAVVSPLSGPPSWDAERVGDVDLEGLAPRARRHEWVLEQMMDLGAVLPLRFGLLYPDLDRLTASLRDRAPELTAALSRVQDHFEWGLTVATRTVPTRDSGLEPVAVGTVEPVGRDYLTKRRAERDTARARDDDAARAGAEIHRVLSSLSTDASLNRPAGSRARGATVVLKASYLVPSEAEEPFRAAAEAELAARPSLGLVGELTGPWPPYHFCAVSLEEVPA